MRGSDRQTGSLFSYVNLEERIPARHPQRKIKGVVDAALASLDADFAALYADEGRPSIAPERLLRASLVQILFSIRSERQLMEQLQYNLLFRWFVGLAIDEPVWVATVFTKNRDRLINTEMSQKLLGAILAHEKVAPLLSTIISPSTVRWSRRGRRSRASGRSRPRMTRRHPMARRRHRPRPKARDGRRTWRRGREQTG